MIASTRGTMARGTRVVTSVPPRRALDQNLRVFLADTSIGQRTKQAARYNQPSKRLTDGDPIALCN
jgi:hypothetical protein